MDNNISEFVVLVVLIFSTTILIGAEQICVSKILKKEIITKKVTIYELQKNNLYANMQSISNEEIEEMFNDVKDNQ